MKNKTVTIDISTKTILKILAVFVALWLLYLLQDIIILIFISSILALVLTPAVDKLEKIKIPRFLGTVFVYSLISFAIFIVFRLIIPPFLEQLRNLVNHLPFFIEKFQNYITDYGYSKDINIKEGIQDNLEKIPLFLKEPSGIFSTVLGIFTGIFGVITVLVLSFYLVLEKNVVEKSLSEYLPADSKEKILNIYRRVKDKLSSWFRGQIILSLFVGALTLLGLLIIGVDYPLALAVFAAFTELIPVIGPFIGAVPAILIAGMISPTKVIWVILLYIIVQQLENHILVPQIMKKVLGLNPVIIIMAMLVGAKLYGILGVLLTIPFISCSSVVLSEIIKLKNKKGE